MGVEKKRGFVKVAVSKAVVRLRVSTRKASAILISVVSLFFWYMVTGAGRLRKCENKELI